MIFVTVGTQLAFDRLVRGVDLWAAAHPGIEIHAQVGLVGAQGYQPQHMPSSAMLPPAEFERLCRAARLIVAHAGTGSFLAAMTHGVPVLAMPRRAGLGEHRNDHQLATAARFAGRAGITIVTEESGIGAAIDAALARAAPPAAIAPFADPSLIAAIRRVVFAQARG